MKCDQCFIGIRTGEIIHGVAYCQDCVDSWNGPEDEPFDTPSLQDSNPEAWGAAHNVNPWGMSGGY